MNAILSRVSYREKYMDTKIPRNDLKKEHGLMDLIKMVKNYVIKI